MHPAARISAIIELVDSLFVSWGEQKRLPADKAIDTYFRSRRYIGSKDRAAIGEPVYWILRHKAALEWWCERARLPVTPRLMVMATLLLRNDIEPEALASLFDGNRHAPAPLTDSEWRAAHLYAQQGIEHSDMPESIRLNFPGWMEEPLKTAFGKRFEAELRALSTQAPADLRTNTLRITRDQLIDRLRAEGFAVEATPTSPIGIRLQGRQPVFGSAAFKDGLFEMQDEGSQLVALLTDTAPGMRVIDFCAGAGGKTLSLAAQMHNKGRILAWDVSAKRLSQLPVRLKRAGVDNTEWRVIASEQDSYIKRHKLSADRVVVDAPCSGTGTWRRNPDLKWRFTLQDLAEVKDAQARILQSAARLVKQGGRLVYATCSVLPEENEEQIAHFLTAHPNFRVVCAEKIWDRLMRQATGQPEQDVTETTPDTETKSPGFLHLTPHQDGMDGFFAAVMERF